MPLPPELLEERKTGLINTLSEQYARNQFSLEEYERLVDYAQKIETTREISLLGRVLQENSGTAAAGADPGGDAKSFSGYQRGPSSRMGPSAGFRAKNIAILSSRKIESLSPDESDRDFLSILGDCQVYVQEGDLVDEETEIHANVLLGEVVIHVPDNVTVVNNVLPIMGDSGVKKRRKAPPESPWNKRLIVTGTAILGNITIKYGK